MQRYPVGWVLCLLTGRAGWISSMQWCLLYLLWTLGIAKSEFASDWSCGGSRYKLISWEKRGRRLHPEICLDCVCMCVIVATSCLTLCNPVNCSPPGSSVHGIVQASVLVQFSHSVLSDSLWPHRLQHARPPCPSPTPRVYSNSCPFGKWCNLTISSSVILFSSCLQSFPISGSLQISQFFASGGQI